jgi:hypothetical protein
MTMYKCNWEGCERKPYAEIYYTEDGESKWSFLCIWHFIRAKLRRDEFAWCPVDTDREAIEQIKEEIWDLQSEIMEIKMLLEGKAIKTPIEYLWDNKVDESTWYGEDGLEEISDESKRKKKIKGLLKKAKK